MGGGYHRFEKTYIHPNIYGEFLGGAYFCMLSSFHDVFISTFSFEIQEEKFHLNINSLTMAQNIKLN